ncbi:hypothetical protein ACLK1T_03815 [Escherichia coli]
MALEDFHRSALAIGGWLAVSLIGACSAEMAPEAVSTDYAQLVWLAKVICTHHCGVNTHKGSIFS